MRGQSDNSFVMYNSGPDPHEGIYKVISIERSVQGDIEAWCVSVSDRGSRWFRADGHEFTRIIKIGGRRRKSRKSRKLRRQFRKTRK